MNVCKNIYIYFFIAFLFFFQVFCSPLNVYDEGIVLVNAKRLLQGETYLKDFWTIYPKGQYWIFESLMKIFGENLLSVRCLEFLIGISFGSCFYFIVRNLIKSSKTAAFSSLIFCYYLNSKSDFLFFPPIYTALICISISYLLFFSYLDKRKSYILFLSFLALQFTALFRIDFFVYSFISYILILAVSIFFDKELFRKILLFAGVSLLLAACTYYTIFTSQEISLYFQTLIAEPGSLIKQYRVIPIKSTYYLYPLLFVLALFTEYRKITGSEKQKPNYKLLVVIFSGFLFLNQLFNRVDTIHSLPVLFFACIIGIYYIRSFFKNLRFTLPEWIKYTTAVILLFVSVKKIYRHNTRDYNTVNLFTMPYLKSDKDLTDVIFFIQNNIKKQDYLYIGVDNHDQFLINHLILYYFSPGKIATKYSELHPGIANTKKGQQTIVDELTKNKPKFIITSDEKSTEPNKSSKDMGLNIIDRYIGENYRSYPYHKSHYKIFIIK